MRFRHVATTILAVTLSVSPTWRSLLHDDFSRLAVQRDIQTDINIYFRGIPVELHPPEDENLLIYNDLTAVLRGLGEHVLPYVPPSTYQRFNTFLGAEGVAIPGTSFYTVDSTLSPVDRAITLAHEMAHTQGYLRESEAEALSCLTLLNSENAFLRACGAYERSILASHPTPPRSLQPWLNRRGVLSKGNPIAHIPYVFVPSTAYTRDPDRLIKELEVRIGCDGVAHLACRNH